MRSIPTKSTGDTLSAIEFNEGSSQELQNSILTSGQTLSVADLDQLGKAMSIYGSAGDFYTDGGSANSYVLTPIGSPARQAPPSYIDGLKVRFVVGNTNTGASTINLNSLGVKSLKENGTEVAAGRIKAGSIIEAVFISLSGQFELMATSTVDLIPASNIAILQSINSDNLVDNQKIFVGGYFSIGDGGGDVFFLDAASTETDNGTTIIIPTFVGFSGTGRWKRIRDGVITSIMAGIVDDATDQNTRLQAFFDSGKDLKMQLGNYVSLSALTIPYGVNMECEPGAHIDFSTASIAGNFPDNFCLNAGDGGLTTLPNLSVSPAKGDIMVTFVSAPGVVQGEIINFNDPTAGSFNGIRPNYRKGEFARVVRVTGNDVLLDGPLFDSYDKAIIGMSRIDGGTINITGSLEITGVALNSIGTFNAFRLIDSETSGISATNSRNAELSYTQCFNVHGNGLIGQQTILSGLGLQYGISVANCQHLYPSGSFSGTRHGATVGGADVVGSIVNRDVIIKGNISSTDGDTGAADHHGNTEFCVYDGIFQGGIIAAGDKNKYRGFAYARTDGIAVLMTEMLGWSHDFSGLQMFSAKDPSLVSRGVFDLGGNANAADVNTTRGGTLDLSNIVMEAPIAKRLITIRNRGSVTTESISVNLNGANFKSFDASALTGIFVGKVSGDNINIMSTYGITFGAAIIHSISGLDVLLGFEENKTFNQATVGGGLTETFAIVFDRIFPIEPKVIVQPEKAGFGSGILAARPTNITKTGFDLVLFLTNGSNLPASNSDINYIASTGTI